MDIQGVAVWCVDHYDPTRGPLLAFFLSVWKRTYRRIKAAGYLDKNLGGMHLSQDMRREVGKVHRLLGQIGSGCSEQEKETRIAEAMGKPIAEIREMIYLVRNPVISEMVDGDGEESYSLFDQIAGGVTPEEALEEKASKKEILDALEEAFNQLQKRQREIVSELITAKLISERLYVFLEEETLSNYEMISEAVTERWAHTGKVPTQKEIAAKHGRSEASVSRTMISYLGKAWKILKDRESEQ